MKIAEIFKSVQGEGPFVGLPVIFIRTAFCNLNCKFCDQPISLDMIHELSYDDINQEVQNLINSSNRSVNTIVWTGGEPTLQIFDINHMIENYFQLYDHHLETNGTNIIDMALYKNFKAVVISPKINAIQYDKYFEQWNKYLKTANNVYFKFLITENVEDDLLTIDNIIQKYTNFTKNPIYLQPLNNDITIAKRIVEYIGSPYYLSMQIHKFINVK